MDLQNKKITVVGLGNSGMESALLLNKMGGIVSVTDCGSDDVLKKQAEILRKLYIDCEIGHHTEEFLDESELFVISPGVCDSSLPVRYSKENNIPIISELELGYTFCKGKIIGVTGTNGKSTVVSLLGEMLKRAGREAIVCGNIGNSLSGEVAKITDKTTVALEVSSFQLERIIDFKPKISIILNIAEDHLDRHIDFKNYAALKKKIFKNQKKDDFTILNFDDKNLKNLHTQEKIKSKILYFSTKKKVKGIFLEKDNIKVFLKNKERILFKLPKRKILGLHNIENILAATLAATLTGVRVGCIEKSIEEFLPLAHRLQNVATVGGIQFIDDSKATNIDSTQSALESTEASTVLIAGGKDKKLSYKEILPILKKKVKKVILIGETKKKMKEAFASFVPCCECDTLPEAVTAAHKAASCGDIVLLSPMCSSFDMFKNYKARGEVFRESVKNLKNAKN